MTVSAIAERISVGGWPGLLGRSPEKSLGAMRDYVEEIRRTDIHGVDQKRRDPEKVGSFLRSFARNVGTYASYPALAAWAPNLRSKSRTRSASKRHFVDPSLAVALLRATPERLLKDLNLFDFLFESLVIRDLRVYAQACDAQVLQYRDNTGLEVDAIIEAADGRWAAFEVKLGSGQIEKAAANLLRFAGRVDTAKCGKPSALGVIVGTGYGYVRPDGVAVVPIGALGP